MVNTDLKQFASILQQRQENLMHRWRAKIRSVPAARRLDTISLDDHIRALLDDLTKALSQAQTKTMVATPLGDDAATHGVQRLRQDFNLIEVVAEYNALREVIQDFAEAYHMSLAGPTNATVNRVLDKAIAVAVQTYSEQKTLELQNEREEHLSFVIHDVKTPLSAISTAAHILDQELPNEVKDERVSTMLAIIHRNARRLQMLLSSFLQESANIQAARDSSGFPARVERREIDLWPLVEDLIHDLQPLTESKPIRIKNEVSDDCIVFADPLLMNQAFQNLLANAIEHTSDGEIAVGTSISEAEASIHCWVSDTGEGIPPERIAKVFDKLESDPNKKGGLGLGLAVVKQIVEAHGGQISVVSAVGQGSKFDFSLPRKSHIPSTSINGGR